MSKERVQMIVFVGGFSVIILVLHIWLNNGFGPGLSLRFFEHNNEVRRSISSVGSILGDTTKEISAGVREITKKAEEDLIPKKSKFENTSVTFEYPSSWSMTTHKEVSVFQDGSHETSIGVFDDPLYVQEISNMIIDVLQNNKKTDRNYDIAWVKDVIGIREVSATSSKFIFPFGARVVVITNIGTTINPITAHIFETIIFVNAFQVPETPEAISSFVSPDSNLQVELLKGSVDNFISGGHGKLRVSLKIDGYSLERIITPPPTFVSELYLPYNTSEGPYTIHITDSHSLSSVSFNQLIHTLVLRQ